MRRPSFWIFILCVGPGLALCLMVIAWGQSIGPPQYSVPAFQGAWLEPKQKPGVFKSFRVDGDAVVGETEPWDHLHPRANSYLRSDRSYAGDVEVSVRAKFRRGRFPQSRYLACYLCYDPQAETGYWLATGHAVGDDPNHAYIKIFRGKEWVEIASQLLAIDGDREYAIVFRRRGDDLELEIDGKIVAQAKEPTYHAGRCQLRLHNTEVELRDLKVRGMEARSASEGSSAR